MYDKKSLRTLRVIDRITNKRQGKERSSRNRVVRKWTKVFEPTLARGQI